MTKRQLSESPLYEARAIVGRAERAGTAQQHGSSMDRAPRYNGPGVGSYTVSTYAIRTRRAVRPVTRVVLAARGRAMIACTRSCCTGLTGAPESGLCSSPGQATVVDRGTSVPAPTTEHALQRMMQDTGYRDTADYLYISDRSTQHVGQVLRS